MKCDIIRITGFAMLVVAAAAAAQAQDLRCADSALAGTWAYSETGTLITPTADVLAQIVVGRYAFDEQGGFSGTQASSTTGQGIGHETKQGTYSVNDDCTGMLRLRAFRSGVPVRESIWEIVLADNATEIYGILTSTVAFLPDGRQVTLQPLMTLNGKRLFRDR